MSIAARIENLNNNLKNAYESLNGLGIDLTNTDKNLKNLSSKIDTLYNELPKVTGEGTEITLTPTKKAKMELDLKGNTEQASYTGKNLLDLANKAGGAITLRKLPQKLKPGTYTFSCDDTDNSIACRLSETNQTDTPSAVTGTNHVDGNRRYASVTIDFEAEYVNLSTNNQPATNMQIEEGQTATSYEPYVGGIASPNPQFPQNIHVVTGNNSIRVQGKNLWGGFTYSRTSAGVVHTYNEDGSITVKGTAIANSTSINISDAVSNNVYKTLQAGTYIVSGGGEDYAINIYDTNSNLLANISKGTASNSFTITETTNVVLRAQVSNGTQIDDVIKLQLEKGSTATNYEAYVTPQNYSINLGSIELCKIGNYQDYIYKENGNWYKYNAIGKLILDGSESKWVKTSKTTDVDRFAFNTSDYSANTNSKCNYFTRGATTDYSVGKFSNNASVQLLFNFTEYGTTTLEQWKTWLSTHNLVLYQPLQEATLTQITDTTLIYQLDAIEKAKSNENQTNIAQTNADLPFIINATALLKNS